MNIAKESWHVKAYMNWYKAKYPNYQSRFAHYETDASSDHWGVWIEGKLPTAVNLCPYVRVILIWSWMRFLFLNKNKRIQISSFIGLGLLINLIALLTLGGKFISVFWLLILFLAIAAGIIIGIIFSICWLKDWFEAKDIHLPSPVTSFGRVLKEYKKATHDKICPIINFVE